MLRGLGADPTGIAVGTAMGVDCTRFLEWFANPLCDSVPSNWGTQKINDWWYDVPPVPAPVPVGVPADLTTPPASGAQAQQQVDQIVADNIAAQQQQNQNFFNSIPAGSTSSATWVPILLFAGGFALLMFFTKR